MSRVLVTKSILDDLADAIAIKGDEEVPLTLEEMIEIVEGLQLYEEPVLETVTKTYTPSSTAVTDTITPGSGYDGIEEVDVTVNAIPSNYVGSGITSRSSSDLTASGDTVTAPSGYYSSNATKTIASGTEGTPTATKGTVSNHSISVTPSVTNSAGYISGGTHTGTAVSVSASELVSGTLTVDSSGTKDVTNYEYASVPAGTAGTPSASKGSVSNHSVSVTPSVTNSAGWISSGTKTGTAVSVSASELVSGNLAISQNGNNIDVTNYATVSVAVEGSGANFATATMTNSSNQNTSISFTLPSGRTPKAFFCRLTAQITRNSNSRYYYVENIRWNGTSSGGVAGRCFYMSSGQLTNITSGYSYSQSGTTFTLSSTGSRSASPGSFYNGQYELVYIY